MGRPGDGTRLGSSASSLIGFDKLLPPEPSGVTHLRPGMRVQGPALIVEPTTTIVLYPGSTATVTPFNNYMVEV